MAALTPAPAPDVAQPAAPMSSTGPRTVPKRQSRRGGRTPIFARIVLACAAVYFIGPILSAFWFTIKSDKGIDFHAYTGILDASGFGSSFTQSLMLAVVTVVLSVGIMVPTIVLVQLKLPKARALVETMSIIPLVVPPVALVVGIRDLISWASSDSISGTPIGGFFTWAQGSTPWLLSFVYVVMAMPFTYRAIDASVQGAGLPTLVEASRNLGGSWFQTLRHVVAPALRTGILNAALLAFALVLGEYTIAKILSFTTFPVWLAQYGQNDGQLQVALSLLSLLVIWLLLILITFAGGRRPRAPRSSARKVSS